MGWRYHHMRNPPFGVICLVPLEQISIKSGFFAQLTCQGLFRCFARFDMAPGNLPTPVGGVQQSEQNLLAPLASPDHRFVLPKPGQKEEWASCGSLHCFLYPRKPGFSPSFPRCDQSSSEEKGCLVIVVFHQPSQVFFIRVTLRFCWGFWRLNFRLLWR